MLICGQALILQTHAVLDVDIGLITGVVLKAAAIGVALESIGFIPFWAYHRDLLVAQVSGTMVNRRHCTLPAVDVGCGDVSIIQPGASF